ncbi:hypothetical protein C8Q80DRAFT_1124715 [Daedaleopsis nitida]|nr:hypothetical protein C8Q80DRAFT_1124715 [Daedaleopsis nitida]
MPDCSTSTMSFGPSAGNPNDNNPPADDMCSSKAPVITVTAPPSLSEGELSECSSLSERSDVSESEDDAELGHRLTPQRTGNSSGDDILLDPLLSSLSSLQIQSRPTTPMPNFQEDALLRSPPSPGSAHDDNVEHEVAAADQPSFQNAIRGLQSQGCVITTTTNSGDAESAKITQERRIMAVMQEDTTDTMQNYDKQLARAHRAIATLQAQHRVDRVNMARLADDIAELLAVQDQMGVRLQRLDDCEQGIRKARERISELESAHTITNSASTPLATYAEELARIHENAPDMGRMTMLQAKLKLSVGLYMLAAATWLRKSPEPVHLSDHPMWDSL